MHLYCPVGQFDWHSFHPFAEPPQQSTLVHNPQAACATVVDFLAVHRCRRSPLVAAWGADNAASCVSDAGAVLLLLVSASDAAIANAINNDRMRIVPSVDIRVLSRTATRIP